MYNSRGGQPDRKQKKRKLDLNYTPGELSESLRVFRTRPANEQSEQYDINKRGAYFFRDHPDQIMTPPERLRLEDSSSAAQSPVKSFMLMPSSIPGHVSNETTVSPRTIPRANLSAYEPVFQRHCGQHPLSYPQYPNSTLPSQINFGTKPAKDNYTMADFEAVSFEATDEIATMCDHWSWVNDNSEYTDEPWLMPLVQQYPINVFPQAVLTPLPTPMSRFVPSSLPTQIFQPPMYQMSMTNMQLHGGGQIGLQSTDYRLPSLDAGTDFESLLRGEYTDFPAVSGPMFYNPHTLVH